MFGCVGFDLGRSVGKRFRERCWERRGHGGLEERLVGAWEDRLGAWDADGCCVCCGRGGGKILRFIIPGVVKS